VDELFDTEEIVVKPLSSHIKDVTCFSGATIMGDGRVAMILDAAGIAAFMHLRFSEIGAEERRRREEDAARREAESMNRRPVLLFNSAPEESFALPLESVSRLEKVDPDCIHHMGPHEFMDYRGVGLPLLRLESCLPVTPLPRDLDEMFVIIPKTRHSPVGILVSRILDTMEASVPDGRENGHPKGLLGSVFLNGRLTLFLDTEELLSRHETEGPESPRDDRGDLP
jgi:two-component system chemotaxis sensor kinase CheA